MRADRRHFTHFILLLLLLGVTSLLIIFFRYLPSLQIFFISLFSSVYVFWGIIHHHKTKDLHPKIVLEYLLISLLGATILISLVLSS